MRIIIDLQGLQTSFSGGRGVGRYTEGLVRNILIQNRQSRKHEILLALNGMFEESIFRIKHQFKDLVEETDFLVWQHFYETAVLRNPHPAVVRSAKLTREIFLNSFDPDMIFSTNLQEGLVDSAITGVKDISSSALYCSTLHDVVPFFYPNYISEPKINDWYRSKIKDVAKSDIILTVSETSRQQISKFTGIPVSKIFSIYNGVDTEHFNNKPIVKKQRQDTLARLELPAHYFLYYGGCDQHKNLNNLIKSYAGLLKEHPKSAFLVIAGKDAANEEALEELVAKLGITQNILFPGFISDADLVTVIKSADAFVFPSLHEGFGLPALEAMACGVATLGSKGTSVAEVIADDEALFDGTDIEDIKRALLKVSTDKALRSRLGRRAVKRASEFAWSKSAEQFLAIVDKVTPLPRSTTPPSNETDLLVESLLWELPTIGPRTKKAIAHAFAESFTAKRRPRLYVDISTVVIQDDRSGIQRVTRAICQELLLKQPDDLDVVPVYSTRSATGFFKANRYLAETFGIESDQTDDLVSLQKGDILLYLDLNPGVAISNKAFNQYLRAKGVKLFHVVYDLLPLLRPATFWPELCQEFTEWVNVVSRSDGAICISRAVADELKDYIGSYGDKRPDPFSIGWFHLGADIDNSAPSKGMPKGADTVLDKLKRLKSFLMVGTVEPRKGHRQTLAAFENLWASPAHSDVALVIVGRQGWGMHDFAKILENHPERGKRLFWLPGISDEYLDQIYERSIALIAASDGEGFGLPLIEAGQKSKPLIARDIPVFQEVAGGHAFFFKNDPHPDVIASAVTTWLKQFAAGTHPSSAKMPWLTWRNSAEQLAHVILKNEWRHQVESSGMIVPGAEIAYDSAQVKWIGFAAPEPGFRWTARSLCSIEFLWDGGSIAHFRMLTGSLGPQSYVIDLNGKEQGAGRVDGDGQLIMFNLNNLREGKNVLTLHLPDARAPSMADPRKLGLSIRQFHISTPLQFLNEESRVTYQDHSVQWLGFGTAESGFRWSVERTCHIGFFWEGGSTDLKFTLGAVALGRQTVKMACNNKNVFSGQMEAGNPGDDASRALQCNIRVENGFNLLTFELPEARIPGSTDPRLLGMAVNNFIFQKALEVSPKTDILEKASSESA